MTKRLRTTIVVGAAVLLVAALGAAGIASWWFGAVRPSDEPAPLSRGDEGARGDREDKRGRKDGPRYKIVADNLTVPWALAFLPDGRLLFTERGGALKSIPKGGGRAKLIGRVAGVAAEGEGGLLGLAVHPDFDKNHYIYLYYTYRAQGRLLNRVVRYKLEGSDLVRDKTIVDQIPGSDNHNGGRIKFGPDGRLYVTTGDSREPDLAQNDKSLAGKILRFNDDGGIPADNPFPGSPVYSLGHRNPQGLAWDKKGRLWATEHGPSGNDEINLIEPGKNYGWPAIEGGASAPGMEKPVAHSNGETWAPSGAAFRDGTLFFAGLRGQALFSLKTDAPDAPRRSFSGEFGRLRDVIVGPGGHLYISTSNRDGRGIPGPRGDRIIRVD